MNTEELLKTISCGETSTVQFKREFGNPEQIAAEIIAFANVKGGTIIFGIEDKTGEIVGMDSAALQKANNQLTAIVNDMIIPQIGFLTEVVHVGDKMVLLVHVEEGYAKPYKNNNGAIWVRKGSDKRRLTDNSEIIRMFQQSGLIHVDELPVRDTGVDDVDADKVRDYLKLLLPNANASGWTFNNVLYENLGIIKKAQMTLGGLMFFAKDPQRYARSFHVKAVSFFGNSIGGSHYRDSRDLYGTIPKMYLDSMSFFNMNLKQTQNGQNFNSTGILEISKAALEELVQNALIHRDYTKNAPVRLLIFDDRIEIISPGSLPNGLTVENIKMGTAALRNNLLASYASKTIMYRGLGSGIIRAIQEQPNIEFINDESGNQFIVKIPREKTN